tara:strand:+ start:1606 stop:1971 length:366 start_codon:yes stop_codon:yes gene_type:complete
MGKKRRILRSPKFIHLRAHRKFAGLVKANLKVVEEEKPPAEEPVSLALEEPEVEIEERTPELLPEEPALTLLPEEPKKKKPASKVTAKKKPMLKKAKATKTTKATKAGKPRKPRASKSTSQ